MRKNDLQNKGCQQLKWAIKNNATALSMLAVFLVFFTVMSFAASPYFFQKGNIFNVLSQIAVTAIIAIGQTYVILTGGIDLSVGSVLAFSGMLCGMVLSRTQSIPAGVFAALATATACGLFNAFFIGFMKMPAFIVTLGTMSIASSLTYVISGGNSYAQFPSSYSILGSGFSAGIPNYLILVLLLFAAGTWILQHTKLGRFTYALGSNQEAVRLSGVDTKIYLMAPYLMVGFLTGMAAVVNSSRLMAVDPTMGKDLQMDTLAAVVIGGTSLEGGKGSLYGTAVGVLLIGFLRNSLNLLGVNPFWQGTAVGSVIIIAVLSEKIGMLHKNHR